MSNAVTKIDQSHDATPPVDPMVNMIERVVMDPNLPIERIEQMMALKERMEDRAREDRARDAERSFYAALAQAQAAVPTVTKNKDNKQTTSRYADLAAIEDQAMPVIRQHGFSVSAWSTPGAEAGFQRIRFRVAHECGHVDEIEDDFALDDKGAKGTVNKTQLHAKSSTVTYARRILLCAYFNIATADDDGNAGGGSIRETVSPEQFVLLRDKLEASGMDAEKFHTAFGHRNPKHADLQQFPEARFDEAMKRLDAYMSAKTEGAK